MRTDLYVPLSDTQTHTVGQGDFVRPWRCPDNQNSELCAIKNHLGRNMQIFFDFQTHYIVLYAKLV